jgi:molecular chaperone GrpE (heat shock protein)
VNDDRLAAMASLLDEIAEDNTTLAGTIGRVFETQEALRADMLREIDGLRADFAGALNYRVLKDLCLELAPTLGAMELMLEQADFADPHIIRGHVAGLVTTLHSVLNRMGAEKIPVALGEEAFDTTRHLCVRLRTPEESPFPDAPPRTIIRVVEDGYTLAGRPLTPARVEIQAARLDKE